MKSLNKKIYDLITENNKQVLVIKENYSKEVYNKIIKISYTNNIDWEFNEHNYDQYLNTNERYYLGFCIDIGVVRMLSCSKNGSSRVCISYKDFLKMSNSEEELE